jgi:hypothetical protein
VKQEIEDLARAATNCRECFTIENVTSSCIDVAQPRWIGSGYWTRPFRVVILMCNPGQGSKYSARANEVRRLIQQFREGTTSLRTVLDDQRKADWLRFYIDGLRLDMDDVAFANVAWCATEGNSYPGTMLRRCFVRHTAPLLELLRPNVVLAAGSKAQAFNQNVSELLPKTQVIPILHHAHRKGRVAEHTELECVRLALETVRLSTEMR